MNNIILWYLTDVCLQVNASIMICMVDDIGIWMGVHVCEYILVRYMLYCA